MRESAVCLPCCEQGRGEIMPSHTRNESHTHIKHTISTLSCCLAACALTCLSAISSLAPASPLDLLMIPKHATSKCVHDVCSSQGLNLGFME